MEKLRLRKSARKDSERAEQLTYQYYFSLVPKVFDIEEEETVCKKVVDKDGNINFPVIGSVRAEGLTISQLRDTLTNEISKSVNDPIVNVHFVNYQVTVLGEVAHPGRYTVAGERVTILDALGYAGDMTPYGKRDNVLVARESDGKMQFERINLNNASVFTSPFFYLQQNDVVYVEPNGVRAINSQNISLYLSMITTLGSMATVIVSVVNVSKK